jgi:hypothetical protein
MKKFRLSTNRVPGKSRSSVPAELNQFTHVEAAPAGIADKLKHPRSRIFAFITFHSTNQPAILTGTMTPEQLVECSCRPAATQEP